MTGFNSKRDAVADKNALFEKFEVAQPAQKIPYPVTGWKVEVRGSNQRLFITGVYGDTIFVDLPEAQPVQPEQEPVAKYSDIVSDGGLDPRNQFDVPQREWVGLTDEEIDAIYWQHENHCGEYKVSIWPYERAIEAKLKEKNNE